MRLDFERAGRLLKDCNLRRLFIDEVGWDKPGGRESVVTVDDTDYTLTPIAEKRSVQIFECSGGGTFPLYSTRQKIEREVRKIAHEHLVVFVDDQRTRQVWQWASRVSGGPIVYREHEYHSSQNPLGMLQRLEPITFVLDDEDGLTLLDVTSPLKFAFDKEAVTKRFYDRFKTEHKSFLAQIIGIEGEGAEDAREWYASLMLNRLMFVYFIQKKGFLDGDVDYLRNRLEKIQSLHGSGQFLSFYRGFLRRLFHEALGSAPPRSEDLATLVGRVPYLNGGLFEVHELEEKYSDIEIPDEAFSKLFDFFDAYTWHLDDRPSADGSEINPDVLGYIFEKYINQKQMGAYYTKEDITGYMVHASVLPSLVELMLEHLAASRPELVSRFWSAFSLNPDAYLPRVLCGPNAESLLPKETQSERAIRLQRAEEAREALRLGEVCSVDSAITVGVDLLRAVQDFVETSETVEVAESALRALDEIRILDPTCGSGAFLFAALGVLEPLYHTCINRATAFRAEGALGTESAQLSDLLDALEQHECESYYVLKRIVVTNLYGVDIMEEAVEICRLRLFLKLIAQVEPDHGLEPLPDIEFNIIPGNALVGAATLESVRQLGSTRLDIDGTHDDFMSAVELLQQALAEYRFDQLEHATSESAESRHELRRELSKLSQRVDMQLATRYGISMREVGAFERWRDAHRPLHWMLAFAEVVAAGGFHVVVGNPPYVEYRKIRGDYTVIDFATLDCGDLYALVMERSLQVIRPNGRMAMIVPVSIVSTDGFTSLRHRLLDRARTVWMLNFAERPSKLFNGVEKRLTIWIQHCRQQKDERDTVLNASPYRRWYSEERRNLFDLVAFTKISASEMLVRDSLPKIGSPQESSILRKLAGHPQLGTQLAGSTTAYPVYYTRKLRYFVQFFDFVPELFENGRHIPPSELKVLYCASERTRDVVLCALNSSLFFWFFSAFSDVRNVNKREVEFFPINVGAIPDSAASKLSALRTQLMADLQSNSRMLESRYGSRVLSIQSFQPRLSKPILDNIDRVLAGVYGFDEVELSRIIRFDEKYRLGSTEDSDA